MNIKRLTIAAACLGSLCATTSGSDVSDAFVCLADDMIGFVFDSRTNKWTPRNDPTTRDRYTVKMVPLDSGDREARANMVFGSTSRTQRTQV